MLSVKDFLFASQVDSPFFLVKLFDNISEDRLKNFDKILFLLEF